MRKKKHRDERLEACSDLLIYDIEPFKKDITSVFGNGRPLHIELGCGKGKFISETALKNPGIDFLACEKNKDVLVLAVEKVKELGLKNVKFFCGDIITFKDIESKKGCDRIYINFCDPLPKMGKRKQRLTHERFLSIYSKFIRPGGEIFFKTDDPGLFEFSLNSFSDFGLRLRNITFDLLNSGFEGNIMTEYETKFSEMGMPIFRCEAIYENVPVVPKN